MGAGPSFEAPPEGPPWRVHGFREARPYAPSRRDARAPLKSAGKSSSIGRGRELHRRRQPTKSGGGIPPRVKETW